MPALIPPAPSTSAGGSVDPAPAAARGYAWLLICLQMIAQVDRAVAAAFAPAIKADLMLSDAQIGGLQGAPFAVGYIAAALWTARARGTVSNPWRWLAGAVTLWTAGSVAFALSDSLLQLALARLLIGAGAAAFAPVALALLAAGQPRLAGVATPGVFSAASASGRNVGILISGTVLMLVSSWPVFAIAEWRTTILIMLVANPVLILILLRRARGAAQPVDVQTFAGLRALGRWLRMTALPMAAFALTAIAGIMMVQASGAWAPSLVARELDLGTAHAGALTGALGLAAVIVGHLSAGRLMRPGGVMRAPALPLALAACVAGLAATAIVLAPPGPLLLISLMGVIAASGFAAAAALISLHQLSPPDLLRPSSAVFLALVTLGGTALGPWATGLASDLIDPGGGGLALALLSVVAPCAILMVLLCLASARAWRDVAAASGRSA